MGSGTKALLVIIGVGGAIAGVILWKRKKGAEAPAEASLEIIPAQPIWGLESKGVGALPGTLTEGSTGNLAVLTITNNSVYTGTSVKAPWTFPCVIRIAYGDPVHVINIGGNCALGPGETKAFSFAFDLPYGKGGYGTAKGVLYAKSGDPTGIAQTAEVAITVWAAAISPGGGMSW